MGMNHIPGGRGSAVAIPHRHVFWALGLVLLLCVGFLCLPLIYGLTMTVGARREAVSMAALSALLLPGGVGYAQGRSWGRRLVDVALWGALLIAAAVLGRALRNHEYSHAWCYATAAYTAALFRVRLRQWEAPKACAGAAAHSRFGDLGHILLMGAVIALVATGAAFFRR